jgi:hypothetical protein
LPILPEASAFLHDDGCLDEDVNILFRIVSEILSIISQGPPPDDGTESSHDFNIRRILKFLIPDGT